MMLSDMLPCGSCFARVEAGTMRYNASRTKLVCESCYGKEQDTPEHFETYANRFLNGLILLF